MVSRHPDELVADRAARTVSEYSSSRPNGQSAPAETLRSRPKRVFFCQVALTSPARYASNSRVAFDPAVGRITLRFELARFAGGQLVRDSF